MTWVVEVLYGFLTSCCSLVFLDSCSFSVVGLLLLLLLLPLPASSISNRLPFLHYNVSPTPFIAGRQGLWPRGVRPVCPFPYVPLCDDDDDAPDDDDDEEDICDVVAPREG